MQEENRINTSKIFSFGKGKSKAFNIIVSSLVELLKVVVSLGIQIVIAWSFGAGKDMDAYFTAYTVAYFFYRMGAGITGNTLIPVMSDYMKKDGEKGYIHVSALINWILLVMVISGVFCFIFSNQIINMIVPGFSPDSKETTVSLLGILIWITVLGALIDISSSILKYYHNFIYSAAAPLVQYSLLLGVVLIFSKSFGIYSLAAGLLAGFVGQFIFQIILLRRYDFHYKFTFSLPEGDKNRLFKIIIPLLISAISLSTIEIADKYFASYLDEGSVSYLGYAYRVLSIVLLASSIVTTVYFTTLSRLAGENNKEQALLHLNRALRVILFMAVPTLACFAVFGTDLLKLFLQKGKFTPQATEMVSIIIYYYIPAIAIWSIWSMCCSMFYAFLNTKIPLFCFLITAVFNIFFDWLFVIKIGICGIALASSTAYAISMAMMIYFIIRYFGKKTFSGIFSLMVILIFSSAISFMFGKIVFVLLWRMQIPDNRLLYALYLIVSVTSAASLFYLVSKIFRVRETEEFRERFINPYLSRFMQ